MAAPKRHHYLPRFYLKRFAQAGKLWVYDRQEDKYRHQTPQNTAVIGNYYSFTTPTGEKNTDLEGVVIRRVPLLFRLSGQEGLFPALSIARLLMLTLTGLVTATCAARLPKPSDAARPTGGEVITGALELLAFNPESVNGIEMTICSG